MADHLLSALLGLLGGLAPGGLKLVWKLRRSKGVDAGTIDLTAYNTRNGGRP